MPTRVFSTHITREDSLIGHIDAVWSTEAEACRHARNVSTFPGVLRASVTVFVVGELGTRRPVVWFRHGQPDSNGRPFPTDGLRPVHRDEHLH